jgi:hypothetical protein
VDSSGTPAVIDQAVGVTMAVRGISAGEAFRVPAARLLVDITLTAG